MCKSHARLLEAMKVLNPQRSDDLVLIANGKLLGLCLIAAAENIPGWAVSFMWADCIDSMPDDANSLLSVVGQTYLRELSRRKTRRREISAA